MFSILFENAINFKNMDKVSFKKWRKKNGFSQQEAASVLGLKRRMIQYYEKGKKGDKDIQIPKYIELACEGLDLKNKIAKLINAKGDSK